MGPKYLEPLQRGATGKQGGGQCSDRHQEAQESVFHHSIPDCLNLAARSPWTRTRDPWRALQWVSMLGEARKPTNSGRLHWWLHPALSAHFRRGISAFPINNAS
jgi:hypothetical protein